MIEEARIAEIRAAFPMPPAGSHPTHAEAVINELIEGYEDVRGRYSRVSQAMMNAQGVTQSILDVVNGQTLLLGQLNDAIVAAEAEIEERAWLEGPEPKLEPFLKHLRTILPVPGGTP